MSSIVSIKDSGSVGGFCKRWVGCQATINNSAVAIDNLAINVRLFPNIISIAVNALVLWSRCLLLRMMNLAYRHDHGIHGFPELLFSPASMLISLSQTMQAMRTQMGRVGSLWNILPRALLKASRI
ncbi:MAG: hypothetical protein HUJ51_02725 [Eggerthellaceae bacterium]|nr:hypothetical protein [Eggerthellaceae bacterium]